jgi:putative flippase GtrA
LLTEKLLNHKSRIIRHGLISLVCGTLDLVIFAVIHSNTSNAILAQTISFLTATVLGYFGHTYFTFQLNRFSGKNLFLFKIQAGTVFLYSLMFIYIFVNVLNFNPYLSKILQLATGFFINYTIGYFISFKHHR